MRYGRLHRMSVLATSGWRKSELIPLRVSLKVWNAVVSDDAKSEILSLFQEALADKSKLEETRIRPCRCDRKTPAELKVLAFGRNTTGLSLLWLRHSQGCWSPCKVMRGSIWIFQRLDLLAFGHFTDVTIDLSAGNYGLHLIFRSERSGQEFLSSSLTDFLYGIPGRTDDVYIRTGR